MKVSLLAQTIGYPEGGGHFWVYLNWALGLRASGARVTWIESIDPKISHHDVVERVAHLRSFLKPYGFDQSIALLSLRSGDIPPDLASLEITGDRAREADLFINFRYGLPQEILDRFRTTALIDIDPGLLQFWVGRNHLALSRHDFYFTIGEGVGRPGGKVSDLGLRWEHIPPCVAGRTLAGLPGGARRALHDRLPLAGGGICHRARRELVSERQAERLPPLLRPSKAGLPTARAGALPRPV